MTEFIGENLWPGRIGYLLVFVSFVAAVLSCFHFYKATKKDTSSSWFSWAKKYYIIHAVSLLGFMAVLLYLLFANLYEYSYVWKVSQRDLPWYYKLSGFWHNGEGSFILWSFWQLVLGFFLFKANGKLKPYVLAILTFTQVFILSMILGIFLFDAQIGISPFALLRDAMGDAPIFQRADYMNFIEDGSGMNPLLQNYWMVIHPPVLFLGYASTVIPFAFAIGSLWSRDYKTWLKPGLKWTLFSMAALTTGIMMGGAWAYEALSFGGFWAWDPVENASIFPWLLMVAGLHALVSFKSSGHAGKLTYILIILAYVYTGYASFLTRSGILGDTSVHSFTDEGLTAQLMVMVAAFLAPAIYFIVTRWKNIPKVNKEEKTSSREFWMFVGALLFIVSFIHIAYFTSIPVLYKIPILKHIPGISDNLAPPTEAEQHYNRFHLVIAVLIGLVMAFAQLLSYKSSKWKKINEPIIASAILSILVSTLIAWQMNVTHAMQILLLFAGTFAAIGNAWFIWKGLKGKLKLSGGALAHIGFGLLMVGVILAFAKQEPISINKKGIKYGEGFDAESTVQNILLMKDIPEFMDQYIVTYQGDSTKGVDIYYKVKYEKVNPETGETKKPFYLYPNVQRNEQMGNVANPDTRHYWNKDVFTHVTSVPDKEAEAARDTSKFEVSKMAIGDTIFTNNSFVILRGLDPQANSDQIEFQEDDIVVGADLEVKSLDSAYSAKPIYYIRGNNQHFVEDKLDVLGLTFRVDRILPEEGKIELAVKQSNPSPDYIIMKAVIFPFINIVWLGIVMMVTGFIVAWQRRRKEAKT